MTQITVQSRTRNNWRWGGTSGKLRIFTSESFTTNNDIDVSHSKPGSPSGYQEVNFTVSGKVITIPSFLINSTTDSTAPTAYYIPILYDHNGTRREYLFSKIRVPVSMGASVSWSMLDTFSRALSRPANPDFYTNVQTDEAIAAAIAARLFGIETLIQQLVNEAVMDLDLSVIGGGASPILEKTVWDLSNASQLIFTAIEDDPILIDRIVLTATGDLSELAGKQITVRDSSDPTFFEIIEFDTFTLDAAGKVGYIELGGVLQRELPGNITIEHNGISTAILKVYIFGAMTSATGSTGGGSGSGGSVETVNALIDGDLRAVTSNAAFDGFTALKGGATAGGDTLKKLEDLIAANSSAIAAQSAIIGGTTPDGDSLVDTVAELLAVFSTYSESVDIAGLIAAKALDSAVVHLAGIETITGAKTFSVAPIVPGELYGAGWSNDYGAASKHDVYTKIEALSLAGGASVASVNGETGSVTLDTGDIPSIADKRYVTDAQLTAIGTIANKQGLNDNLTAISGITPAADTFLAYTGGEWRLRNASTSKTLLGLNNVVNLDTSVTTNITDTAAKRFVSDTEKTTWNSKQNALAYTPENIANKGAANGYVPLNSSSVIDSIYLPSYVDDIIEAANLAALPGTGETGKIYVTLDTNFQYRWSGSAYIAISSGGGGTTSTIAEGSNLYFTETRVRATLLTGYVTGANSVIVAGDSVLGAFQKAQGQIDNRQPLNTGLTQIAAIVPAADSFLIYTSGEYRARSIATTRTLLSINNVVNLDTSTTANITDSADKRFVTDANLTSIGTIGGKVTANGAITPGTFTKISFDAKGLITSGAAATTADFADTATKRFVTDTQISTWDAKQNALGYTAENIANKGAANGYAPLDGTGKIASSYLPSFVDDVLEYANLAAFPGTGETGKMYVTLDNNKIYRWSGTVYVEISGSPGTTDAVTEGATNLYFTETRVRATLLTGATFATNSAVLATDSLLVGVGKLQTQVTDRVIKNAGITGGTFTKITFDTKGLVTGGAAATTADFAEVTNLYFTNARAIAAPLTSFATGANSTILAADTILGGLQKAQGQIDNRQPLNANLTTIGGLTVIEDGFLVGRFGVWASRSAANSRVHLGLGTMATAAAADYAALAGAAFTGAVSVGGTLTTNNTLISNFPIELNRTALATGANDSLKFINTTAATSGVPVQRSPNMVFQGQSWDTTATAARTHQVRFGLLGTSGGYAGNGFQIDATRGNHDGTFQTVFGYKQNSAIDALFQFRSNGTTNFGVDMLLGTEQMASFYKNDTSTFAGLQAASLGQNTTYPAYTFASYDSPVIRAHFNGTITFAAGNASAAGISGAERVVSNLGVLINNNKADRYGLEIVAAASQSIEVFAIRGTDGLVKFSIDKDGYMANGSNLGFGNFTVRNSSGTGGFEFDGFGNNLYFVPRGLGTSVPGGFIFFDETEVTICSFSSNGIRFRDNDVGFLRDTVSRIKVSNGSTGHGGLEVGTLYLLDGSVKTVTFGANDSAGTGFKTVRIPN